jgi:hypothetical protein
MTFDKSKSKGRWMWVTNSRGSGFTYFKSRYWGYCDASRNLADEFAETRISGETFCPKVWMKVRDSAHKGKVKFLARPGEKFYVQKDQSVGKWMYVKNERGEGFSYYKPKYWRQCAQGKKPSVFTKLTGGTLKLVSNAARAVTGRKLMGVERRPSRLRSSYVSRYNRHRRLYQGRYSRTSSSRTKSESKKKKRSSFFGGFKKFFGKVFKIFRFGKEKVPKEIVEEVRPVMFVDHVACSRYAEGLTCTCCPEGKFSAPEPALLDHDKFVDQGMKSLEKRVQKEQEEAQ